MFHIFYAYLLKLNNFLMDQWKFLKPMCAECLNFYVFKVIYLYKVLQHTKVSCISHSNVISKNKQIVLIMLQKVIKLILKKYKIVEFSEFCQICEKIACKTAKKEIGKSVILLL